MWRSVLLFSQLMHVEFDWVSDLVPFIHFQPNLPHRAIMGIKCGRRGCPLERKMGWSKIKSPHPWRWKYSVGGTKFLNELPFILFVWVGSQLKFSFTQGTGLWGRKCFCLPSLVAVSWSHQKYAPKGWGTLRNGMWQTRNLHQEEGKLADSLVWILSHGRGWRNYATLTSSSFLFHFILLMMTANKIQFPI